MYVDLKELFSFTGEYNEKVLVKLLEALKMNASQEMDYLKFKKSYESLCQLGMDESTAAKSAFVTAETMGLNKSRLLDSVHFYQQILKKEKEAFALALKNQISKNVDAKRVEADKLQARKVEILTKIEKMKEELAGIDGRVNEIQEDIKDSSEKIESTRQQFVQTIALLEKEIQDDLEIFTRVTS